MADRNRRRGRADVIGFAAAASVGLALVMIGAPADRSVIERIGLWALICGIVSAVAYLKTKHWD